MFGCLVAGRLVQGDPTRVDETHFIFNLVDTENISHVVIFMLGTVPFPDGLGGAVYFGWPTTAGLTWQYLGHVSNDKPSAIFKLCKAKPIENAGFGSTFGGGTSTNAQIGIAVESINEIIQRTPNSNTQASKVESFREFSQKMLESFFNYASSFAVTQSQMVPQPDTTFIPADAIQKWFDNFQRKLSQDLYFWRT
ncbi:protein Hikeshi-like [Anneissia japonica]|uniref:protein Hikeshi-like n=1 Tax=Anneissia japonica TaxID=1529436 RepID=UPI001425A88C|nr:protein Hikeshi-like [Anneissia japonica]